MDVAGPVLLFFIAWGTFAVGVTPVIFAWLRYVYRWYVARQIVIPKALCILTVSICIDPAGHYICEILADRAPGRVFVFYILLGFFALGFLLNLLAFVVALRERIVARTIVLAGSAGVAVTYIAGFVLLYVSFNEPGLGL